MHHIKILPALAILGITVIAGSTALAVNTGSDIGAQSTVTSTISVFTPQTTTPPAPEPSGPAPEPSGPGAEPETTTEEEGSEGNGETEE